MRTKYYVCGVSCFPGGKNCNNYCNHDRNEKMPDNPLMYEVICPTTQKTCEHDLLCNTTCFLTQNTQPTSSYIAYEDLVITASEMEWPDEIMEMINKLTRYQPK